MKVALIDVDGHNFPSLPLMKLSAWHKKQGDSVEWYDPLLAWQQPPDRVYISKVFTFTSDYQHPINAKEIVKGGTGYNYPNGRPDLKPEIEHIYPDYSLYPTLCKDTAYGFLTRGCPRGCDFCIVASKEGRQSRKVADLSEFWNGQKNITLRDLGFSPYVMIFNKQELPKGHILRRMQRWANSRFAFHAVKNFADFK